MHAVDGVDLEVYPGETLGLVGESGCGKSTLARVIMRLLRADRRADHLRGPGHHARCTGRELRAAPPRHADDLPGSVRVAEPPQDASARSSASRSCSTRLSRGTRSSARSRSCWSSSGLNPEHYNRYPHEFSGGQRQRIGVARALALEPEAHRVRRARLGPRRLDPGADPQPAEDLQDEFSLTYLFIAHDLAVVRHVSDRIAVMYLGKIVEMRRRSDALYSDARAPVHGRAALGGPDRRPEPRARRRADHPRGRRAVARSTRRRAAASTRAARARSSRGARTRSRCSGPQHPGQVAACHFPLEDRADILPVEQLDSTMLNVIVLVVDICRALFLDLRSCCTRGRGAGCPTCSGAASSLSGGPRSSGRSTGSPWSRPSSSA